MIQDTRLGTRRELLKDTPAADGPKYRAKPHAISTAHMLLASRSVTVRRDSSDACQLKQSWTAQEA